MSQNKPKQRRTTKSKLSSAIRSFDSYGIPVTLTLNDKSVFKTVPGGLLSIISRLGILIYFWTLLPYVVDKKKEVIFKDMKVHLEGDNDPFRLTEEIFDVGLRLTTLTGPISDEMLYNRSKYFKFEASTQRFYQTLVNGQMINALDTVEHELGACSSDRFGNLTEDTAGLGITGIDWVCPKSVKTNLTGTPVTLTRTTFRVRVVPCNKASVSYITPDNVTCASDEEIQAAIEKHFIQFAVLKQYFDENEFDESPVKKEVSSTIYNIDPSLAYFKITQLQRVNVTTKDSWMSSQVENKDYQYFQMIDSFPPIVGHPKPAVHDMLTIMFTKYDHEIGVVRQVVSLSDIISQCGGFASFIVFMSLQFSKMFQPLMYQRKLIKNLFKQENQSKPDIDPNDDTGQRSSSELEVDRLWKIISSRKPPDINLLKMKWISRLSCCALTKAKRQQAKIMGQKVESYNGQLNSTIDIRQIVDSIRKTQLLSTLILHQYQREFLPFTNNNLLQEPQSLNNQKLQKQGITHRNQPSIDNNQATIESLKKILEQRKLKKNKVLVEQLFSKESIDLNLTMSKTQQAPDSRTQKNNFGINKQSKLELEKFSIDNTLVQEFTMDRMINSKQRLKERKLKDKSESQRRIMVVEDEFNSSRDKL